MCIWRFCVNNFKHKNSRVHACASSRQISETILLGTWNIFSVFLNNIVAHTFSLCTRNDHVLNVFNYNLLLAGMLLLLFCLTFLFCVFNSLLFAAPDIIFYSFISSNIPTVATLSRTILFHSFDMQRISFSGLRLHFVRNKFEWSGKYTLFFWEYYSLNVEYIV